MSPKLSICDSLILWSFVFCIPLAGCGQPKHYDGPARVQVTGQITLDGQPIPNGNIFFDGGRRAGGEIVNGRYEIKESYGPVAGLNRVRFSVKKATGEFEEAEDGEVDEITEEVLPEKYTRNTGIEVEFKPSQVGRFDFDIKLGESKG